MHVTHLDAAGKHVIYVQMDSGELPRPVELEGDFQRLVTAALIAPAHPSAACQHNAQPTMTYISLPRAHTHTEILLNKFPQKKKRVMNCYRKLLIKKVTARGRTGRSHSPY